MNDFLSLKKVSTFQQLLAAYKKAFGKNDFDALDGGGGSGSTARQMAKHLESRNVIYTFEPFPGNHRFFSSDETQIILIRSALAAERGSMAFRVSSVVDQDSAWGKRGMAGYSSVGYLVSGQPTESDILVDCVRADDIIPETANIGFVKIDLQGGELNALKGMQRTLKNMKFMWIEFSGQVNLLDYLLEKEMVIFDTEYFFKGSPDKNALVAFEPSKKNITLSTGKTAWFGFRKKSWKNFEQEFTRAKKELSMVQTDLVCIPKNRVDEFIRVLQYL